MVNLKLALGQLVRDPIYHEAVPEFQTLAYFKTTVHLRNAFQVRSAIATVTVGKLLFQVFYANLFQTWVNFQSQKCAI